MVRQQYVVCGRCQDVCFGEVVRAYGQHYHIKCFSCEVVGCSQDLLKDGFFIANGAIYCRKDYHKLMGRKCSGCKKYVEGEVISALDRLYHATCFKCHLCMYVFPPDTQICYDGTHLYCDTCNTTTTTTTTNKRKTTTITNAVTTYNDDLTTSQSKICVGCHVEIKTGQALIAGDKSYHLWCFKCKQCNVLLTGDYMAHQEDPYCEACYHSNFGVVCDQCNGFITGKVLQAGEKCYHPRCSKCAMCGEMFNEGEEMYLQGSQIWHPKCNKNAMRQLDIASRDTHGAKRDSKQQVYDSDASADSTAPPPTECYDASRSYNESIELVDPEDMPTFPVMKTNVFGLPGGISTDVVARNKERASLRTEENGSSLGSYNGELVIDVNRSSRNSPTKEDDKKDFYRYLVRNDHHHLDHVFQDHSDFSHGMTSPSHMVHSPRSLSSPGSFRSANSSSGFHSANSPNGYHSSNSQITFRSANSPKSFPPPKPTGKYKHNSASSSTSCIPFSMATKQRGSPPPYESVVSESPPPPIPPPPTKTSSKKWRQKHECSAYSTTSKESSFTKAQQMQLRRLSFSKAMSSATDDSRHNTLTDYSDMFISSATSSSDGFDETSSYKRHRETGLDNVLTTYA